MKKKQTRLFLLIGAGAVAFWYLTKNNSSSTTVIDTTTAGNGTNTDGSSPEVSTPLPPPVTYTPPIYQPTDTNYATKALIDQRQQYFNALNGNYPTNWLKAFEKMASQSTGYVYQPEKNVPGYDFNKAIAELKASYEYIRDFWSQQKALTSASPLYTAIMAIHNKYNIF